MKFQGRIELTAHFFINDALYIMNVNSKQPKNDDLRNEKYFQETKKKKRKEKPDLT